MIADIVTGKTATADVFFLVALILFVLAAASHFVAKATSYASVLVALGLASTALAFFVL